MATVEDFIYERDNPQRDIMLALHQMMLDFEGILPQIRYRIPFYYRHNWICYINPKKDTYVELCFLHGFELSNAQGLLQAKDRKMVKGIEIYSAKEIQQEALWEIIQEALLLDEEKATKRKKKL